MVRFSLLLWLMLSISCSQSQLDSKYVDIKFENLSISEFLEKVSKITGKKIMVDQEIKGKINFVSNEPILKSELIPLANAILETKEMTLVNKGEYYYTVVKSYMEPTCILLVEDERNNEPMSRSIFYLNSLNGAVVRTKIKPLLPKGSKVVYSKLENTLTITSSMRSLKSIQSLINKIQEIKEKK